jgi:hypothetical protein
MTLSLNGNTVSAFCAEACTALQNPATATQRFINGTPTTAQWQGYIQQTVRHRAMVQTAVQLNPACKDKLYIRCQQDILFWFKFFAHTYDPRLTAAHTTPDRPFILFPYQEETVCRLVYAIETGEDLIIEKSRDMGLSWLIALVFQWYWQFKVGSSFLIGSRKLALVDQLGDLSSIFGKIRYNLQVQPAWLLPTGYQEKKHSLTARLINPANDNAITGEACTEQFARGGRYRAILMDEFAFWQSAEASFMAAGFASPCRLLLSTPNGLNNCFAQLRHSEFLPLLTLHWQLHPFKTQAWYEQQCKRMTEDMIARELDINYQASVKNRVFPEFKAVHQQVGLQPLRGLPLFRVWDFGFHCPAVLFCQIDTLGRLLVLREEVGHQEVLRPFAQRVLGITETEFAITGSVSDFCDPAGHQHQNLLEYSSVELLNKLGIYPTGVRTPVREGLEKIRHLLIEWRSDPVSDPIGSPALLINPTQCPQLCTALMGAYRFREHPNGSPMEIPLEEHPFEDVVDCLRYAVWEKGIITGGKTWQQHQSKIISKLNYRRVLNYRNTNW